MAGGEFLERAAGPGGGVAVRALLQVLGIACALFWLAGCSHREQASPEQRMAVEAKVLDQIALPVYPGASVEGYVTSGRGAKTIHVLFLRSQDPLSKVTDFYKSRVPKNSKNSVLVEGETGTANFTFEKGPLEKQITLTTGSGATEIELLAISPK